MTKWAAAVKEPVRVVDPGAGTGRFIVAAGRRFPRAQLYAVEVDPLAALLLRANLACARLTERTRVVVGDYRETVLPRVAGPTLFLGNPPYVRHHQIDARWKAWLTAEANELGIGASQLSGLHVHFFLATARSACAGDYGVFITAAEWLDVNYGRLVRRLVLGPLGGQSLHLLEPKSRPFSDADTTAVVTCFEVGSQPAALRMRRVESVSALGRLERGRPVRRERLEAAPRWTPLTRRVKRVPEGFVELGELCRVHRGQVTGNNGVWIAGAHATDLPARFLFASVTKARELFAAGAVLADVSALRRVVDLPEELDVLSRDERERVDLFLRFARKMEVDQGFIARHRKAWWSVGLREPAPILATYMARRPPAFVRNPAGVRHINIAHGLYPREQMSRPTLDALARYLSGATSLEHGRTYAGGLTKFEPREMERLLVPTPAILAQRAAQAPSRREGIVARATRTFLT
jgi:hypothetical protein